MVGAALGRIGAERPSWKEGQPELTQDGHSPYLRTRCIRCGWKLPDGHLKFCSAFCAKSFHNLKFARERRAALLSYARAYRAARRKEHAGP